MPDPYCNDCGIPHGPGKCGRATTSVLRDRIAGAISREDQLRVCKLSTHDIRFMADAVIAELGLRMERGERSKPDGPLWGRNNRYTVNRWVTEWKADDE